MQHFNKVTGQYTLCQNSCPLDIFLMLFFFSKIISQHQNRMVL